MKRLKIKQKLGIHPYHGVLQEGSSHLAKLTVYIPAEI